MPLENNAVGANDQQPSEGSLNLADRLGIGCVVLLPLHERLDVGRRDEPHLMAQLADLTAPEMSAAAGFHRHNTGLQLAEKRKYLIPSRLLAQHRRTSVTKT